MGLRSEQTLGLVALAALLSHAGRAEEKPQVLRDIPYVKRGDGELRADLYVPAGKGPFPGVLVVHGGAWLSGNKRHMGHFAEALVRQGYTVMSIAYRLAPRHKFPAQVADCKAAVRWMRRHASEYKIDPQRLAGLGYSAGGHLVAMLGTTDPASGLESTTDTDRPLNTRLQAIVAGGAPCDFSWIGEKSRVLSYFLGGTRAEKPNTYRRASPTFWASADDPPAFFFHGEADRLVPPKAALALRDKLKDAGVRTETYIVPRSGHLATFFDRESRERSVKFLDEVFKRKR